MHELALSQTIVDSVLKACPGGEASVRVVAVQVGALSAVNADSLEFCLGLVLQELGLTAARAEVTWVPARIRCACGQCYETDDMMEGCPKCGGYRRDVLAGKDVTVQYVEVDDEED